MASSGSRLDGISLRGSRLFSICAQPVSGFGEGQAVVSVGGRQGVINEHGQFIVFPEFDSIGQMADGCRVVTIAANVWFLDRAGRSVGKSRFRACEPFHHGVARVNVGGRRLLDGNVEGGVWGVLSRDGHLLWPSSRSREDRAIEP